MKIRMAWPKLYHRVHAVKLDRLRLGRVTWGGRPAKESLSAQVFVQIGPMYTITTAGNLPVAELLCRSVEKPGIPSQGTVMVRPSISATLSESGVKLPHGAPQDRRHGPILPDCDSVRIGIHYLRNSDPCGLQEKQPTALGATSRETLGLRVRVETPAPPAIGKERFRRKCVHFRMAPDSNPRIGVFFCT